MNPLWTINFSNLDDRIEKKSFPMVSIMAMGRNSPGSLTTSDLDSRTMKAAAQPYFLEDIVESREDGWAALVKDIGEAVKPSCCFVSFGPNAFLYV